MVEPSPPIEAIHAELNRARSEFHQVITHATAADLRLKSAGTDWSNRELLFHMLFGYLITRNLLVLVTLIGHAPDAALRAFASVLDAATPAFLRRAHEPCGRLPLCDAALRTPPAPADH